MKLIGLFLLLAGGSIVVSSVALLASVPRSGFVLAGLGVEVLGLALVARAHLPEYGDKG